jgi:hypothetical protein
MRALVNNRKRTASPLPTPRWIALWRSGHAIDREEFLVPGLDESGAWQVVMDATFEGYRADRIGDCIYLTGRPTGFSGGCQ